MSVGGPVRVMFLRVHTTGLNNTFVYAIYLIIIIIIIIIIIYVRMIRLIFH